MPDYDGVVIGAGHNGLTCACYLARAGMRVLVLEAAPAIGGMTTTTELVQEGFWTDVHASGYALASLSSAPDELALHDHGLELIRPEVALSKVFTDGSSVSIQTKLDDTCESIATHSRRDADTWRELFAEYLSQKDRIREELENPPQPPGAILEELGTGRAAQQRLRSRYQSARSWATEAFESAAMRDLLADFAGHAGFAPDDAGGAAFSLAFLSIMQDAGNRAVKGGMGKVAEALASALRAAGGEIRTSARVQRIVAESGAAVGVRLDDGEVVRARVIASSAHPRHFVLDLLRDAPVASDVVRDMERYELGVSQFGIYLTLREPISYVADEAAGATQVHLMPPTTDGLAEAFQQVRADELPAVPSVFTVNEATVDPTRVPAGASSLKIILTTVPTAVDWAAEGDRYAEKMLGDIGRAYIPDLQEKITGMRVMTPDDYERDLASSIAGTVTHGAMTLYQQGAMRPSLSLGQYRGPLPGTYLCGAGSHPGPGVSMMPGRNAATVILADVG